VYSAFYLAINNNLHLSILIPLSLSSVFSAIFLTLVTAFHFREEKNLKYHAPERIFLNSAYGIGLYLCSIYILHINVFPPQILELMFGGLWGNITILLLHRISKVSQN